MLNPKILMSAVLIAALCSFSAVDLSQAQQSGGQASSRSWVLPPGWRLSDSSEGRAARRYVSPDGQSSVSINVSPSGLRGFEGAAGERVTYQRQGRSWMVVSGFRGDRIFYRKALRSCRGSWRYFEFEYPAAQKRRLDRTVTRASKLLSRGHDPSCG